MGDPANTDRRSPWSSDRRPDRDAVARDRRPPGTRV